MKKIKVLLVVCLMLIVGLVGTSDAFITKTGTAKSNVVASSLNIEVVMLEEVDGSRKVVSSDTSFVPGATKSRIATVKNIDKQPAWLRVKLEVETSEGTKSLDDFSGITLNDLNNTEWTYKEGYFYYTSILNPGETTKELFKSVSFDEHLKNDSSLNLKVNAEATQSKHNGSTVFEAKGWPAE